MRTGKADSVCCGRKSSQTDQSGPQTPSPSFFSLSRGAETLSGICNVHTIGDCTLVRDSKLSAECGARHCAGCGARAELSAKSICSNNQPAQDIWMQSSPLQRDSLSSLSPVGIDLSTVDDSEIGRQNYLRWTAHSLPHQKSSPRSHVPHPAS